MEINSLITVIIITKNEEEMIADCIESVSWAKDILIVDTGNTDRTNEIAKRFKNVAIVNGEKGKNFSDWRNTGLKAAKGKWILYLDADERILEELKGEILSIISSTSDKVSLFAIPRRNIILGKELRHGGWYPDYQKRLFLRSKLKRWRGDLHEEPEFEGRLEHIKSPMLHIKHEDFSQMVEKTNKWSEVEAKLMFDAGHPKMNIPRFITAMLREFWHRMIVKRAFLDGRIGIMFALYQVFSRFISYAKLWEMQIKKS